MSANILKLGLRVFLSTCAMVVLVAAADNRLAMTQHMEILSEAKKDVALAKLPSINIGKITTEVDVNDRIAANDTYDRPFVDALSEGLRWYLTQREMQVVEPRTAPDTVASAPHAA